MWKYRHYSTLTDSDQHGELEIMTFGEEVMEDKMGNLLLSMLEQGYYL
jgi:hypothetical protein